MSTALTTLTADHVRDLLDYDDATGNLKWRKNVREKRKLHEGATI